EPVGIDFKAILAENMVDIVRWIVALAALALLVFGLRPVLARVLPQRSEAVAASTETGAGDAASAEGDGTQTATAAVAAEDPDDEATVHIAQVRGDIKASKINRLTEIIEENREEAIKVMKAWIARE